MVISKMKCSIYDSLVHKSKVIASVYHLETLYILYHIIFVAIGPETIYISIFLAIYHFHLVNKIIEYHVTIPAYEICKYVFILITKAGKFVINTLICFNFFLQLLCPIYWYKTKYFYLFSSFISLKRRPLRSRHASRLVVFSIWAPVIILRIKLRR